MLGGAERWADCTDLYSSWQKVWLWRKEMSCLCQHFTDLESKLPVLIHCILNVILSDSEAKTHSSLCFCCFAFLLWTWPSFCPPLHPLPPPAANLRVPPTYVFISPSGQWYARSCWTLLRTPLPVPCSLMEHLISPHLCLRSWDRGRTILVKKEIASRFILT